MKAACIRGRFFTFILAVAILPAFAQSAFAYTNFRHLTTADGLSGAQVFSVLQDQNGYIWLATESGLDRYDGYDFKSFTHNPSDPHSISANLVRALCADAQGRLWVGTFGGGLDVFDPAIEGFRHYVHTAGDPNTIASNNIWSLASVSDHLLVVGTFDAGIDVLDTDSGQIRHYPAAHASRGPSSNRINSIYKSPGGSIWLATDSGLDKFVLSNGSFERYQSIQTGTDGNNIWGITEDRENRIWLATQRGLAVLLPGASTFTNRLPFSSVPATLQGDTLRDVFVDRDDNLWIASAYSGIYLLAKGSNKIVDIHQHAGDAESLSSNTTWNIYEDRSGLIWIATDNGVNLLDLNVSDMIYIKPADVGGSPPFVSNKILSLVEHSHGLFIGSTAGIYTLPLDPSASHIANAGTQYDRVDVQRYGTVTAFYSPNDQDLIAGTSRGYLLKLRNDGKLLHAWLVGADIGLPGHQIFRIVQGRANKLYLGTFGNGLLDYDLDTATTRQIADIKPTALHASDNVECILPISDDQLLVGTFRGLYSVSTTNATSSLVPLTRQHDEPIVESLYRDRAGTVWVGAYDGLWQLALNELNSISGVRHVDAISKATTGPILAIDEGRDQNLWLASTTTLLDYHPQSGDIRLVGHNQGLPITEYYSYPHVRTSDGWLWFGGAQGLLGFDPSRLQPNTHAPQIVVNGVNMYRQGKVLQLAVSARAPLQLSYQDSIITFDLAALDFVAPAANTYSYRLLGLQPEWTTPTHTHQIIFTSLNPGSYHLDVRAANNWGTWSSAPASVDIIVLPPWWRTWWAYTLYVLMTIGSVTAYIHNLQRKIRREKEVSASLRDANELKTHFMEVLESQVKKATYDLRETLQGVTLKNAELEIAQKRAAEGEQIKSQFLANMSHELRTPLTGVLGFTKLLAGTPLTSEQKDFIGTIRQSSESLLAIINDTLDLSRLEAGKLLVDEVDFDLLEVIESTLELLAPIAYQKRLELVRIVPPNVPLQLRGDPLRLRQVLTNLLSNAIKFTESGSVSLKVELITQNDREATLSVVVTDSGIGIPEGELSKLFHAYARSRISVTRQVEGTGLGLAICKKLLDLMGGQIEVSSKLGSGSMFRFQLPFRLQKNLQPRHQLPGRPQILLYDTHPLSSQAWEASLTRMGAYVRRTADLEDAASIHADAALIVLTDKEMVQLTDLHAKLTHNMPPALVLAPRMDRPTLTHVSETLFHRVLSKAAREGAVLIELQSLVQTALPHAIDTSRLVQPVRTTPGADAPLILVTDDNRINRRLLVTMLHQAGMRAAEAASGLELIQLAQKGPWSAALVDIHMPGMDGIEAAERLYKLFGEALPPIIAMSADVMPETRKQVLAGIICDFLMKPFNEQQLIDTLRKHLERHATQLSTASNTV